MWPGAIPLHVLCVVLVGIQAGLLCVLFRRLHFYHFNFKRVLPEIVAQRLFNYARYAFVPYVVMAVVRSIDPFTALNIWPYWLTRVTSVNMVVVLIFQSGVVSYHFLDTSYRCAMKVTPKWLIIMVVPLSVFYGVLSNVMLLLEAVVGESWCTIMPVTSAAVCLLMMVLGFDFSGYRLIQVLTAQRRITKTINDQNISRPSSSAEAQHPVDTALQKTYRCLLLLNACGLPTACWLFFGSLRYFNRGVVPVFLPDEMPPPAFIITPFIQQLFGLIFTWLLWIDSKSLAVSREDTLSHSGGSKDRPSQSRHSGQDGSRTSKTSKDRNTLILPEGSVKLKRSSTNLAPTPTPSPLIGDTTPTLSPPGFSLVSDEIPRSDSPPTEIFISLETLP